MAGYSKTCTPSKKVTCPGGYGGSRPPNPSAPVSRREPLGQGSIALGCKPQVCTMFGDGGDVADQGSLAFGGFGGGDGELAEYLLQDDYALGECESEAEASAHASHEWEPGVRGTAAVEQP